MTNSKIIRSLSLVALNVLLANCSARSVVVEANPYLDPNPVINVDSKKGDDPMAKDQWNLTKISSSRSGSQDGSRRVKVALLSTGVDYTHEDLAGSIFVNRTEWTELTPGAQNPANGKDDDNNGYKDDFVGYDFVENDGLPFDRNGAGTAMAGVLGAMTGNALGIRGVVSDVSIVPVRFVDGSGHVLLPNLFKALSYAIASKVDVILLHTPSYEFGSTAENGQSPAALAEMEKTMLKKLIEEAKAAGIPIVASAGNSGGVVEGSNSLTAELSSHTNVTVVTSVDTTDARPFIANYGRERVHTTAPGKDILTTIPGNKYGKITSTSLAAAHVAGAVALGVNQTYGRVETRKLLEALINPEASDAVEGLKYETIGGNRLNITKYLTYLGTK